MTPASPCGWTPSTCVHRKGTASSAAHAATDHGAISRARGGASVIRRMLTSQSGNSRRISRCGTRRTSGFRGLPTWKSYHTMSPSSVSTRTISDAIRRRRPPSSTDVNTVDCSTMSKLAAGCGSDAALPADTVTDAGTRRRAVSTRSGTRSIPVRCAGSAPHRTSSFSQNPVPHPTSSTRCVPSRVIPCRASNSTTRRARVSTM